VVVKTGWPVLNQSDPGSMVMYEIKEFVWLD
jgi:hypothetical protein